MNKFLLKCSLLALCAGVLCLPANASAAEKKIIMRYSHSSAAQTAEPHHAAATAFKQKVEELSKGKVEVQIYPGSQLGGEERSFQDIQNKVIQIASLAVNNSSTFSPSMYVFDLPYIFASAEDVYKCIDGNWDKINERMIKESGNMAVGWLVQGFRVLSNNKRPVEKLADLKGLKIRVPNNPLQVSTFRAWDCEPTPLAWDETFNALQQKVVDGQENPYTVFASNKFEEVQKYITEIHYKMWIGPIVVNADWLKSQPADVQKAIIDAGRYATDDNRKLIAKMEAETIKGLEAKGVKICRKVSDEPEWQKRAMSVWPGFYAKLGDLGLLDSFLKTLNMKRP